MIETWLDDDTQTLVFLGFQGDRGEVTIYIPLDAFGLSTKSLQAYKGKVIVKRPNGTAIPIAVPIEEKDGRPWARFVVPAIITKNSGLYCFQFRAVNSCFRLLTGAKYRSIVFGQV